MELHMVFQRVDEPPVLEGKLRHPLIDNTRVETMTLCLIERGMVSGEPSVIIASDNGEDTILLQTSLDKYLAGASMMVAKAESWGWVRPEGSFTLMPPDKETRKALLEALKKELEEYE